MPPPAFKAGMGQAGTDKFSEGGGHAVPLTAVFPAVFWVNKQLHECVLRTSGSLVAPGHLVLGGHLPGLTCLLGPLSLPQDW